MDAPAGVLLALDTSSTMIGYALHDGAAILAEAAWQGQRQGTTTLLAAIWQSLTAVGKTKADLAAVAVATGPGSFSGLRVGLGIGKGLALALGAPIVGVSTLAVTAAPFTSCVGGGGVICALVTAGRGRYAFALYADAGGELTIVAEVEHGDPAEVARVLEAYPKSLVCGEMDAAAATVFAAVSGATVPPVGIRGRRPGALADLGWQRILEGRVDDLVTLEPTYLHTAPVRTGKG